MCVYRSVVDSLAWPSSFDTITIEAPRYNIVNERDKQDALRRTQDYLGSASKKRQVAVMGKPGASR